MLEIPQANPLLDRRLLRSNGGRRLSKSDFGPQVGLLESPKPLPHSLLEAIGGDLNRVLDLVQVDEGDSTAPKDHLVGCHIRHLFVIA